ncbi:hypothetical protein Igag_0441 [Ignisphaera aggregans DSM 17230]|uniref:Uncharacterized protein n=1 Tax=Ignisphaera aggregans (strain DSM 17230 / JCM 13409 / AQ1.S1) TaxID=583356 RepID=E0SRK4_IGNAA|nr:hypothetical protein Igag_0441 [Ignisphaera aggregans DSM 17230]
MRKMFRDILNRLRGKRVDISSMDRESLQIVYRILYDVRIDLVEAFYKIKDRRLRDIYDPFSMLMLKLDKLIQYLRRILGEPLYAKYDRLSQEDIENYIYKLPLELSITLRNLIHNSRMLKDFASSSATYYLKSMLSNIDDEVEDIAKHIDSIIK